MNLKMPLPSVSMLYTMAILLLLMEPSLQTESEDEGVINALLNEPRVLPFLISCLTDKLPCPPRVQEMKSSLSEALQQACQKCTPSQIKMYKKITDYLIEKRHNDWVELMKKFDPQNKFKEPFLAQLKANKTATTTPTVTTTKSTTAKSATAKSTTPKSTTASSV